MTQALCDAPSIWWTHLSAALTWQSVYWWQEWSRHSAGAGSSQGGPWCGYPSPHSTLSLLGGGTLRYSWLRSHLFPIIKSAFVIQSYWDEIIFLRHCVPPDSIEVIQRGFGISPLFFNIKYRRTLSNKQAVSELCVAVPLNQHLSSLLNYARE